MKSARGIYYDIKESDYYAKLNINNEEIVLYFSSLFLRKKFLDNVGNYIHNENLKLSIQYKIDIDATKLLILSYYKRLEKRGFRVLINDKEVINDNLSLTVY